MAKAKREKMKLVIDARESGTSTGRYVDKLVEYLHKLEPDFEVVIFTKLLRLDYFKNISPRFEAIESNYKEFTFAEQGALLKQIRAQKAELVHFSMTQQPVWYNGKAVTTIHDLTTARFHNPAKNMLIYKFKQQVYKWVIKRVARKSEHIITASEYVKNDLVDFTHIDPAKVTVIYEAADEITDPAEPVESLVGKKFIMYIGRPTPHKNLERLVEAMPLLLENQPELLLALAGKPDENYERIKRLVAQRGLGESIIFTGFASEGQLRWLYENTAAYIFPSLSEGFGLPGLEAMVHGAPVVSSNATCLPEIYGKAAHYFDPYDVSDIAAKIEVVLTDDRLRKKLIENGKAQAKKYSWQKMAKQTLDIYKQVLNK
jgi:glycosyltransferase involved in cell wall biosynthesis